MAHSRGGGNLDVRGEGQILISTKKTKFINPFDPLKVHGELTAYHRRWVHAFPRDQHGLAFQAHHAIPMEEDEEEDEDGLSVSGSTLSPVRNTSMGSFNVGSYTHGDGRGLSWSDGQEFRGLSQAGRRGRYVSGSGSLGETLVPISTASGSVESHDEQGSENQSGSCKAHAASTTQYPCPWNTHTQSAKWDDYGTGPETLNEPLKAVPLTRPAWSRRRKKSAIADHRLSDASIKAVEDFTSVQRTGVDWKSLTEPACLPVTVDFFPSESKLNQDYYQSPSKLVVSSYDDEFDVDTGSKYVCVMLYITCCVILMV